MADINTLREFRSWRVEAKKSTSFQKLPNELLEMIGEWVMDRKSLYALARQCWAFHEMYWPMMHRHMTLDLNMISRRMFRLWSWKLYPKGIVFTRTLEILHRDYTKHHWGADLDLAEVEIYAAYITTFLERMPHLTSIWWYDFSLLSRQQSISLLCQPRLVETLKGCKDLRNLYVQVMGHGFTSDYITSVPTYLTPVPLVSIFKGFENLTSLELHGIYGPEEQEISDLVYLLRRCQSLRMLGLSKKHQHDSWDNRVLIMDSQYNSLEHLCLQYCSDECAKPFKLRTLKLGPGMLPLPAPGPNQDYAGPQDYLERLVELGGLHTLHVWNGVVAPQDRGLQARVNISWAIFQKCLLLRALYVTSLDDSTRQWLNTGGTSVQELLIIGPMGVGNRNMQNLTRLNLQYLKTLHTVDGWDDFVYDKTHGLNWDASEQLVKDATDDWLRCVLDPIYHHRNQLVALSLSLELSDYSSDHLARFLSVLSKLKSLRQLRITKQENWADLYPDRSSVITRLLRLLKLLCPSLQFVKLGYGAEAWEVTSRPIERFGGWSHITSHITCRRLSLEEVESITLFAINTRDLHCGFTPSKPNMDLYDAHDMCKYGYGEDQDQLEATLLAVFDEVERPYSRRLARVRMGAAAADADIARDARDTDRDSDGNSHYTETSATESAAESSMDSPMESSDTVIPAIEVDSDPPQPFRGLWDRSM